MGSYTTYNLNSDDRGSEALEIAKQRATKKVNEYLEELDFPSDKAKTLAPWKTLRALAHAETYGHILDSLPTFTQLPPEQMASNIEATLIVNLLVEQAVIESVCDMYQLHFGIDLIDKINTEMNGKEIDN